jgi:mono/diheme cytochrome c family protein
MQKNNSMKAYIVAPFLMLMIFVLSSFFSVRQDTARASIERGKKVYEKTCLACHQANGSGVPGMNPPLKKTKYILGDKKALIGILQNGLDEEIEINGKYFNNPMPAQAQLTDQEMADVLTYARNSFGNSADPVTVAEVKMWRKK